MSCEFDSYSNLAYTPECEVVFENGESEAVLLENCMKNPGHKKFIPVQDIQKHLPVKLQDKLFLLYLQNFIDRTVKVTVPFTSQGRPDTYPDTSNPYPDSKLKGGRIRRNGTGFINYEGETKSLQRIRGRCPCHICQSDRSPKFNYWEVEVSTARHVVFDHSEASRAVCDCFYDSEDKANVKYLYGIGISNCLGLAFDQTIIKCVTHDEQLSASLEFLLSFRNYSRDIYWKSTPTYQSSGFLEKDMGIIVSHPHGLSKKVSLGNIRNYAIQDIFTGINSGLQETHSQPLLRSSFPPNSVSRRMVIQSCQHSAKNEEDGIPPFKLCETRMYPSVDIRQHLILPLSRDARTKPLHQSNLNTLTSDSTISQGQAFVCPFGTTFQLPSDVEIVSSGTVGFCTDGLASTIVFHEGEENSCWSVGCSNTHHMDMPPPPVVTLRDHVVVRNERACGCEGGSDGHRRHIIYTPLPPSTRLILPHGGNVDIPFESEVQVHLMNDSVNHYSVLYATYDMSTCPGCSGAPVITDKIDGGVPWYWTFDTYYNFKNIGIGFDPTNYMYQPHAGALEGGLNLGCQMLTKTTSWCCLQRNQQLDFRPNDGGKKRRPSSWHGIMSACQRFPENKILDDAYQYSGLRISRCP